MSEIARFLKDADILKDRIKTPNIVYIYLVRGLHSVHLAPMHCILVRMRVHTLEVVCGFLIISSVSMQFIDKAVLTRLREGPTSHGGGMNDGSQVTCRIPALNGEKTYELASAHLSCRHFSSSPLSAYKSHSSFVLFPQIQSNCSAFLGLNSMHSKSILILVISVCSGKQLFGLTFTETFE